MVETHGFCCNLYFLYRNIHGVIRPDGNRDQESEDVSHILVSFFNCIGMVYLSEIRVLKLESYMKYRHIFLYTAAVFLRVVIEPIESY